MNKLGKIFMKKFFTITYTHDNAFTVRGMDSLWWWRKKILILFSILAGRDNSFNSSGSTLIKCRMPTILLSKNYLTKIQLILWKMWRNIMFLEMKVFRINKERVFWKLDNKILLGALAVTVVMINITVSQLN